jgi:hypothetical protein
MGRNKAFILAFLTFIGVDLVLKILFEDTVHDWCETPAEYFVSRDAPYRMFSRVAGLIAAPIFIIPSSLVAWFVWKRLRPCNDGESI